MSLRYRGNALMVGILLFVLFVVTPGIVLAIAFCPCCGIPCPPGCSLSQPGCRIPPCPICTDLACQGICLPGPGVPTQCDVKPGSCKNQPETGSPQGAKQAMEMASQLMSALQSALQGGGGGGGGAGKIPPFDPGDFEVPTFEPTTFESPAFDQSPLFGNLNGGATGTSSSGLFGNILGNTVGNTAGEILSNVFGGSATSSSNTGGGASTGSAGGQASGNTTRDILDSLRGIGGRGSDSGFIPVESGGAGDGGAAGGQGAAGTGGTSGGARGALNTEGGIADFLSRFLKFGGPSDAEENAFLARLCGSRPWQATLITRVLSTNFFDTLCERYGFIPQNDATRFFSYEETARGRAFLICAPERVRIGEYAAVSWDCSDTQSSGFGFNTGGTPSGIATIQPNDTRTYILRCANGGSAQCTVEVDRPRAEIAANPERVPLGTRAQIFWTSENAVDCIIEGPNLKERGIKGAATTAVILDKTTFTIMCTSEEGYTAEDSVVIEPGI